MHSEHCTPRRALLATAVVALGMLGAVARGQDFGPSQVPSATPLPPDAPGAPTTPAGRIALALRSGDRAGALDIADEYLKDHPRDAQVRFLRGVVLGDLNRTDEAIAVFERLTQDYPELPEPYNNLAAIRASQGQYANAERYLQLAIAAQPEYVTARENLGDLYLTMAAAEYEQALKMAPENAGLKKKLALARELNTRLRIKH